MCALRNSERFNAFFRFCSILILSVGEILIEPVCDCIYGQAEVVRIGEHTKFDIRAARNFKRFQNWGNNKFWSDPDDSVTIIYVNEKFVAMRLVAIRKEFVAKMAEKLLTIVEVTVTIFDFSMKYGNGFVA